MSFFWDYVDKQFNSCWPWTGETDANGFGTFRFRGKTTFVQKVAYMLHTRSKVPAGLYVCQRCENKLCCNPNHLFIGTYLESGLVYARKGRHLSDKNLHGNAQLRAQDVKDIRRMYATGAYSQAKLARQFNVCRQHVSDIIRMRRWKWIKA
jgi:predicted XRE-type DNA-binding protein